MYAVITGASSGFGIEFARQFAKRGCDLCIVARRETNLESLKKELTDDFKIHVDVFNADLSLEPECQRLHEFTKGKQVNVLVNNAGIAIGGMPDDIYLGKEIEMLNVNVRAVHLLTRHFLTDMIARNNGRILNISSLSGWLP